MEPPLVSIVIPTYNRAAHLLEAIRSVRKQFYHPIELIIVDDASTDNTLAMLEVLRPQLSGVGIRLRVLTTPKNLGAGAALDAGFKAATGEFISYLASDDKFIDPWKTTNQVQAMTDTEADWSYFRDFCIGKEESSASICHASFVPRLRCYNRFIETHPRLRLLFLLWRNPINSSSLMIRKDAYQEFGGWEGWTKNANCDGLLLMRYSHLGLACTVLDGSPIFYRTHSDQVSLDTAAMVEGKTKTKDWIMSELERKGEPRLYMALARKFRWMGG